MNLKKQIKLPLIISVISMVLLMNAEVAIADDLQSAFQKEYAYLEEQKRNLVSRLASFKATSAEEKKTLSKR